MMGRVWWLFLLMCLCPLAHADYPAKIQYAMYNTSGGSYAKFSTPDQACNCSLNSTTCSLSGSSVKSVYLTADFPPHCMWKWTNGAADTKVSEQFWFYCPYGGTLSNMTCIGGNPPPVCTAQSMGTMDLTSAWGTGPQQGSGIASKVIPDGAFAGVAGGGYASVQYCDDGCTEVPNGMPSGAHIDQTPSANGYYRIWLADVPMYRTGGTCTVDAGGSPSGSGPGYPAPGSIPSSPSTPNTKGSTGGCPDGTVSGGQDPYGMTICIGQTKPPSAAPPSTTTTSAPTTVTNSDGSTTTTQNTTTTNSDGSTSTVTKITTTAPDGSTTVKTNTSTGTTPGGVAGTQDRPQDQTDLCKLHPELNICQNSQVVGTCGDITCTGDAIQCATLRAAAAIQCKQQQDSDDLKANPSTTLGSSILAGADPSKGDIDTLIKGDTVDMSAPTLDQGGFVGGGACIPDKTFTVMGHAVTVSFSTVCSNIQPLRYIVMACAFILVYLMVARSVING